MFTHQRFSVTGKVTLVLNPDFLISPVLLSINFLGSLVTRVHTMLDLMFFLIQAVTHKSLSRTMFGATEVAVQHGRLLTNGTALCVYINACF